MLVSPEQLALFLSAAVLVTIAPGPDNLATLGVGLSQGWRSAVGFGVGCGCGCLFHTALAALGVSAIIRTSPVALTILQWSGAAWLAWLGIGALRSSGSQVREFQGERHSGMRYFGKGVIANAINPKVSIFFLSFLPQFVDESLGRTGIQMMVFGLIFTLQAILIFAVLGFYSGAIGQVLRTRPQFSVWLDRLTGVLFITLALKLALEQPF
jgi:threonine/homoserine/homoserine lactone efflux protein